MFGEKIKTRYIFTTFIIFISFSFALAQNSREIRINKLNISPEIDGKGGEPSWNSIPSSYKGKFYNFSPINGNPSSFQNEIKFGYTDRGIYVLAQMYDPAPDSISRELGLRDDLGRNADIFGVCFDTYKNGQSGFYFIVASTGVQSDIYISNGNWDGNWDAVWKSSVKIDEKGWTAEMEIPWSALRFPKEEIQTWGINFTREVKRRREESYWNHVDNSVRGFINQFGVMKGLENISPPVRLSFLPYLTTSYSSNGENKKTSTSIVGGMDLKYGVNESFTIDVSLIPDFSQVQSDNVVLNLSPFEVRFSENRPFFTEGTDLFNKGGFFYSRRVGQSFSTLTKYEDNESIISEPSKAPLINAVKFSGRNKKALGIGVFNAVTGETSAIVENEETGERREVVADPLTNFNILVLDQNLKNNSSLSLINTNVTRAGVARDANVTGTDFDFFDKSNTYALSGTAAISNIISKNDSGIVDHEVGYKYRLNFAKVSGKYYFNLGRSVETKEYNINDLGYIQAANDITHSFNAGYRILKPVSIFNRINYNIGASHSSLYEPRRYAAWSVYTNSSMQFKNFVNLGLNLSVVPTTSFDYFEPRVEDKFFERPSSYSTGFWFSTDGTKRVSFAANAGIWERPEWGQKNQYFSLSPYFRINDKLAFNYDLDFDERINSIGFVKKDMDENDELKDIIFGERNIYTVTSTFGSRLTFNSRMGLNLRMRHYWSRVDYDAYFDLQSDGSIIENNYNGLDDDGNVAHNKNFNAFNLDFVYSWQIAPGSFMNIVWKDAISSESNMINPYYMQNLENTFQAPRSSQISLKILYFIDYQNLKKKPSKPADFRKDKTIA